MESHISLTVKTLRSFNFSRLCRGRNHAGFTMRRMRYQVAYVKIRSSVRFRYCQHTVSKEIAALISHIVMPLFQKASP